MTAIPVRRCGQYCTGCQSPYTKKSAHAYAKKRDCGGTWQAAGRRSLISGKYISKRESIRFAAALMAIGCGKVDHSIIGVALRTGII
ncbi:MULTISPECIES: hypothetical protein [unclassified Janthinobacterium]|uniref:hypothetical protein n=1 Tax=unclassified Janthinobacterium TaxID=2610881 RepID=UPI001618587B|nr:MULTISPECIES: hypothetical protein [unclassified Janthinobacterium]MBB5368917.1 hypothetical protein [Janthinobacterium sp. K2C7]MBB5381547.1 hypothetical protein [Janthinobacterium sp. K2Li3]MBB5387299.1 hypothetical protein [Janthinobacterium sp. K2E3]